MNKEFDIVVVGELLVDLIGHEIRDEIFRTHSFRRFQGGSPANLGANMTRLGKKVMLISSVGKDGMGEYLIHELENLGLSISNIKERDSHPTSLVLLSRSHGTPDFIAYREADRLIHSEDIQDEMLSKAKLFHTTCFALSKEPAQSSILDGAERAYKLGVQLSIDLNYAPSIWPDHAEALRVVKQYCSLSPFVKVSQDDCNRIFQREIPEQEAIEMIKSWGAKLICFTKGKEGSHLSLEDNRSIIVPADEVKVMGDATGAGDAYWAGFLSAWLEKKDWVSCVKAASKMAAFKLSTDGPLPEKVVLD